MIKFSVVIPLYNKVNFIKKTLQSVFDQTYADFEVIVVNDGSTDGSRNTVLKIVDDRITVIDKENEGVSIARNVGIKKAKNDYITFLDADDLWLPDYLETISKLIKLYPDAGVYATTYNKVRNDNNVRECLKKGHLHENKSSIIEYYCKALVKNETFQLWTGAICVKKSLFNDVGYFSPGVKRGEDIDMWLRLSLKTPIAIIDSPKVNYYMLTENNAMGVYKSYKESFPYWEWYNYGKSKYLKMYTTLQIMELIKVANKNKVYGDAITLLLKIKGLYYIHRRIILLMRALLRV